MRIPRVSLRSMFILTSVAALWFGLYIARVQRQRDAVAELRRLGADVLYERHAYHASGGSLWLATTLGPDFFYPVYDIHFRGKATDESLRLLRALPQVEGLQLGRSWITAEGLNEVARLSRLKYLGLSRIPQIGDDEIACLTGLTQLSNLSLDHTAITDASLPTLAELPSLHHLNLGGCNVTDRGIEELRGSRKITSLRLYGTKVTASSAAVLATVIELENVWWNDTMTDEGLEALRCSPKLKELTLEGTRVTPEAVVKLKESKPFLIVRGNYSVIGDPSIQLGPLRKTESY